MVYEFIVFKIYSYNVLIITKNSSLYNYKLYDYNYNHKSLWTPFRL